MTHENDAERELAREDAEFVERLRELHAPEPMPPARRTAFMRQLAARLEARPRRGVWIGAVLAPVAALALAWLYVTGSIAPSTDNGQATVVAEATAAQWAYEVLNAPELSETEGFEDSPMLPDDYLAIGSEFLDS
jgi:hypothetical protein